MVTVSFALLLGLAILTGVRWRVRSLKTYYFAVAGALAIWTSSLAFINSYTVILPLVLGALASLVVALVGIRAARRAHLAGDGSRDFWIGGVCAALLPFLLIAFYSRR